MLLRETLNGKMACATAHVMGALTRLGCSEFDDVAGDAYPLVFDADAVRRRVVERADELFQVISRYEEYVP